jgi:O-acetylhomoserine/O-acetylserine sulfhydrylase-like pyridoxal-dependent enzyme
MTKYANLKIWFMLQVYMRLDQPMAALEVYRTGLEKFHGEVTFLTGVARIYEAIGNLALSAKVLVVREELYCKTRFLSNKCGLKNMPIQWHVLHTLHNRNSTIGNVLS